jgi:hypothetical protein
MGDGSGLSVGDESNLFGLVRRQMHAQYSVRVAQLGPNEIE